MKTVAAQVAKRNFSAKTIRKLSAKGINLIGVQMLPNESDMSWANARTGFVVNDNGCSKVWTFSQVTDTAE